VVVEEMEGVVEEMEEVKMEGVVEEMEEVQMEAAVAETEEVAVAETEEVKMEAVAEVRSAHLFREEAGRISVIILTYTFNLLSGTGGDGNNNNNDINDPPTASPIDMLPTDPTIRIPVTGSLNELRFNKVLFENNNVPIAASTLLPLLPEDFPLSSVVNEDTVNLLRQSLSWSVIAEDDCHQCEYPFSELITAVGGLPTHPDINDPNNGYWEELWDVIEARRLRLLKASPISVLQQIPAVWAGYSLDDMADAVHNEYPGTIMHAS
jgi:hypothetical protein